MTMKICSTQTNTHTQIYRHIENNSCLKLLTWKKEKLGTHAIKSIAVGNHFLTPWLFKPVKHPDIRAAYKRIAGSPSASTRYSFLCLNGVGHTLMGEQWWSSAQWAFPANWATQKMPGPLIPSPTLFHYTTLAGWIMMGCSLCTWTNYLYLVWVYVPIRGPNNWQWSTLSVTGGSEALHLG